MGLFDKLFGKNKDPLPEDRGLPEPKKTPEMPKVKKPRKPRQPKAQDGLSEKEKATAAGEPYIAITKIELDPNNVNDGAFELDWNDKFVLNLIKSGYKQRPDDTDQIIVERWFQYTCRNVALELFEQQQADPENRDLRNIRSRDIGNGRTEVS
jgi:hypothetical protein